MAKRILVTGAGSGFGKGCALALAQRGHHVIAGVENAAHEATLQKAADEAGAPLQIAVLDITDAADHEAAFAHEIDVLVNNAGVMEAGPVAEIPMERVRRNFEINVFGTLALTQGFARQMVRRGSGKIIFVSSMNGLVTVPFLGAYGATKHALESIAEALKTELAGTGVEICTVNPGAFATGLNDRAAEIAMGWLDLDTTFLRPEFYAEARRGLEGQFDPQLAVDALVRIVEEDASKFRNVVPEEIVDWIKAIQQKAWEAGKDDPVWIIPTG